MATVEPGVDLLAGVGAVNMSSFNISRQSIGSFSLLPSVRAQLIHPYGLGFTFGARPKPTAYTKTRMTNLAFPIGKEQVSWNQIKKKPVSRPNIPARARALDRPHNGRR